VGLPAIADHDMVEVDGIWQGSDQGYEDRWSALAAVDAVHAAISTTGDDAEAAKSADQIEMVLREASDGVILDVGCGYGRIAKYVLPVREFDGYVGLDGSITMLRLFRDRYRNNAPEQRTPLMLLHGRIDDVRLSDGSVDNVVIVGVLLHNPKKVARRVIAEARRVLRAGGKLIVMHDLPNSTTAAALPGHLYLGLLALLGRRDLNGPLRYWSKSQVRRLFVDFEDVRILENGLAVLPKRIIGMPVAFNHWYRRTLYESVQRFAEHHFSARLRGALYGNVSVIATK
jgi:SAM-dependent methyltransferase